MLGDFSYVSMVNPQTDRFELTANFARDLPRLAEEMGLDIAVFAKAAGLNPDQFDDLYTRIPIDSFTRMLSGIASLVDDDTFGLRYGAMYRPDGAGPFGYGMLNAPTLRHALKFAARFMRITIDLSSMTVKFDEEGAHCSWTYSRLVTQPEHLCDYGVMVFLNVLRRFFPHDRNGIRVELSRPRPKSAARHKAMMCRDVSFESFANTVHFAPQLLDRADASADVRLYEVMCEHCETLLKSVQRSTDIVSQVSDLMLERGEGWELSLNRVAERLGCAPRTLQRRLGERGLRFRQLLAEIRHDLSDRLLRDSTLSINEISNQLHFSAPSAYSRFVKRSYRQSPRQRRMFLRSQMAFSEGAWDA